MKYVIIGAGCAGSTATKTIRAIDAEAKIIIIGEERYFPYNRFLLTEYLCGVIDDSNLFYLSSDFFRENNITFRKGQYVKAINPENKTIKLLHNEVMEYDKLLIATGGRPELGPVLRPFAKHIRQYYSLKDILLLKKELPRIKNCIVYGEGLSTLDCMCGLCNLDKKVTYIVKRERAEFPLITSEFDKDIRDILIEKGVEVITGDRLVAVEKIDDRYRVTTLNQKELIADIVFAWDYYRPHIDLIEGTNIEKKLGILVNQKLQTSVDDIYAAGDCVEIYHPKIKDYWINFGWPNAQEQGIIAAKNMTGQSLEYQIQDTITFRLMGKSLKARWWE